MGTLVEDIGGCERFMSEMFAHRSGAGRVARIGYERCRDVTTLVQAAAAARVRPGLRKGALTQAPAARGKDRESTWGSSGFAQRVPRPLPAAAAATGASVQIT